MLWLNDIHVFRIKTIKPNLGTANCLKKQLWQYDSAETEKGRVSETPAEIVPLRLGNYMAFI